MSPLDLGAVAPQGAEVARRCPTRAQWDVVRPAEPRLPSPSIERRRAVRRALEAEVRAALLAAHPDAVVVDGEATAAEREAATTAALVAGAPVVVGARLPVDERGRRVADPDVLLAAGAGTYHPARLAVRPVVDRPARPGRPAGAWVATVARPWRDAATLDDDAGPVRPRADLLRLAHARRVLEACGRAAPDATAAVIGPDGTVAWHDLDEPLWSPPGGAPGPGGDGGALRSTLELHDDELAARLAVIAAAERHRADPTEPLLSVPVRIGECESCPWWDHCRVLLEATDDVSLLPRTGLATWLAHTTHGVRSVADLAGLDHRTASLHDAGVDLPALVAAAERAAPGTPAAALVPDADPAALHALDAAGVATAADAAGLDRRVVAYHDAGWLELADAIDQARARHHPAPALLARGVTDVVVPRADVEVDLDLESTEDGVYLWGALVTDRSGRGLVPVGYQPHVTWEPVTPESEAAVTEALLAWFVDLRALVAAADATLRTYCFFEQVEAGSLRRIAASGLLAPERAELVEALVAPDVWTDLHRVARRHLVTGAGLGLKALAPLAGFAWEDDDPGGEQSMLWHDRAVAAADPAERDSHRRRLLTYNRNDVEATLALREWLATSAPHLPHLESTDGPRPSA